MIRQSRKQSVSLRWEEEMSWKTVLKAPPFDAVRYEEQVSTPRKMTFPSFFSQILDTYIENTIKDKSFVILPNRKENISCVLRAML